MKTTKDLVFEFVRQSVYTDTAVHDRGGVETRAIAQALGKQRSNISAALNELIKEGKLAKTSTRPVLYKLPEPVAAGEMEPDLSMIIGNDGSFRTAFQLAKAAIRYPKHPLNILISAQPGCGTSVFVSSLYRYAVQNCVVSRDVPLVKINCRHYTKDIYALDVELFGTGSGEKSCFDRARGGMLVIDGFDLLDARQQSRIFSFLDTKQITMDSGNKIDYSDVYLILTCSASAAAPLKQRIPMVIELPSLADRPIEERLKLINHFFETEAKNWKRNVAVSSEAVKVLLVTEFPYNAKELQNEILKACMNACVRSENGKDGLIRVVTGDFSAHVQQNLLGLRKHAPALEQLLDSREEYIYDEVHGFQSGEPATVPEKSPEQCKPVLLYAMHGTGTAQALSAVTNALSFCDNAYSYELPLDCDARTAKDELQATLWRIDRGAGIIVIYDMGSIKTMLDAIMEETGIKIRCLQIPLTLVGVDTAHKCQSGGDVDAVYHAIVKEMREQNYYQTPRSAVIITLCHTGEAGAQYFKEYIDKHSRLGLKTIAWNISGRKLLLKEAMELKRTYKIHAFVGTYDPKLLGIPYIPATRLLDAPPENMDRILMFEPAQTPTMDYSRVYEYLQEQLKYASVAKLKRVLPDVVDELTVMYDLDADRMQGLFIHLASMVERILSGGKPPVNPQTKQIVGALAEDYRAVSKILRKLEKSFRIIIDDNAIATLIMILKKI